MQPSAAAWRWRSSRETIELLQRDLPPAASVFNPIDVIGDARSDRYRVALAAHWPTQMWMLR